MKKTFLPTLCRRRIPALLVMGSALLLPQPAAAIPSPDLIINLSASIAQLAGLLSVVLGGVVFSRRRVVGDGGVGARGPSRLLKWSFRACLALLFVSLVGNAFQHARQLDEENRRLQANLMRPSVENGARVGDVSLHTLAFSDQQTDPMGISTDDLASWQQQGKPFRLIDVREDEEVETGRIVGARAVRYPDLKRDPSIMGAGVETVLMCYSGNRSSELCANLAKQGKACHFVVGGYEKWIAEGKPLAEQSGERKELRSIPDYVNKDTLLGTQAVMELVTAHQALVLDVRYPQEFEAGHVTGSVNVPVRRMPSDELSQALTALPKGRPVVTACYDKRSCFYSQILGLKLARLGFDYRGRYTTPHEFFLPKEDKGHVADWKRMREGETALSMLAVPLRNSLNWLRAETGHYALAVLLLVVGLRLLLLPLAWKADRDQRMQRLLASEVTAIKERFARQPRSVSRAVMSLYRKNGIKPFFNALSSIAQLMLFIVFFSVVDRASADWNDALLWVEEAGRTDPIFVLPGLVGVLFGVFLALTLAKRGLVWMLLYVGLAAGMVALASVLNVAVNLYLVFSMLMLITQFGLFAVLWNRGPRGSVGKKARGGAAGIVRLVDADRHPEVGQKAARLATMLRAGFLVPDGFVMSHLAVAKGRDPKTGEWRLSRRERALLNRLWRRLKSKTVAVRSSGMNEDGVVNSYAGVFESVLHVPREELEDALERVSASLNSDISNAYAAADSTEKGGVLIQAMVDAEYAGVLFTEHPASAGCSVVELVSGLGESLVAGRVTPSVFRFGRLSGRALDRSRPPIELGPLLAMGRRLEDLFGGPQDVEWAYADGKFVLLQSRDITSRAEMRDGLDGLNEKERGRVLSTVRLSTEFDVPVLVQNELSELLPNPTPVSSSLMEKLWSADGSTDIACRMLGIPYDVDYDSPPYVVTVYGALYVNRAEEKRRLQRGPGISAAFRLARAAEAIEADFREGFLPGFLRKLRMHEALDLGRLADSELFSLFERWSTEFVTETYVHAELINLATDFYWKTACQKLSAGGHDPVSLLAHHSDTVVTRAMSLLGASGRGSGHVKEFLELFGHRAPEDYELAQPRFGESPELVIQQAARARRMGSVSSPGAELPADPVLRLTVDRARRFQVLKEEAKHHCLRQIAQLRRLLLELDRRLGLDGGIFQLYVDEIPHMAHAEHAAALRARIAERAAAEQQWRKVRLPAELTIMDIEAIEPMNATPRPARDGELSGTRVSGAGGVEGRVHVLHNPSDVRTLKQGEIVVARLTDPSWYPVFPQAGGIVTEVGGWLSHAAIVAREFNLTAIVGVRNACETLRTGDLVRLEADGHVVRLERAGKKAAGTDVVTPIAPARRRSTRREASGTS